MTEIDTDLLEFKLPKHHKPGSDRLSRLLALQPEFIDLVTAALVDSTAGTYNAAPTNFLDKECDAIYVTRLTNSPPIILEFQARVDMNFIHRAFSYCMEVYKKYNVLPIVLVINTVEADRFLLVNKFKSTETWPYMLEMECSVVAKRFYLLTRNSIKDLVDSDEPLTPLVAAAHFFISRSPSIIGNSRWDDENIRLMYRLCMKFAGQDGVQEVSRLDTLKRVCIDTHDQFEKIVKWARLDPAKAAWYALAGMEYTAKTARQIDDLLSSGAITPMGDPDTEDLVSDTLARKSQKETEKAAILDFVEKLKTKHRGRMNWAACFGAAADESSMAEVIARYSNPDSFKRAYYRLK
ncbi:uncharacterized protein BYT42DRAFT_298178 [Radiomyces spectabilis]|uniref:uncharacterized protein n=1 Tax=Radiomyces spectabilis TaxID=64574 RepID=UPI00222003A8|nr:uncharacterized protein BYT42DRAFT_298178 [Radiomyces spectabilis]KAI8381225.1 hypothetical protein BYT42DRAFT_298178 [Radiomyces spectabilis]